MDIPLIRRADRSGRDQDLARIKLPPGFKIGLYAIVPDARPSRSGRRA
jgi:hypothetical protein